nr:Chain F, SECTTPC peptide [hepatitis C virus genotype 1a]3M5N_G Chain G, SECTTPC peptide [hepatitis C virus genotype 1a]3M5N_H Chain H, SECTTPC peptide [hepatitis C virus genotype 1a]
SECTTPC